jgi:hypothetical protein
MEDMRVRSRFAHFKSLCLLAVLLLNACVPSLHPLYTADTIIRRDEIIGVWKEKPDSTEVWTFTKADDKGYKLVHEEKEGAQSIMDVRVVKLGESLFLDLFAADAPLQEAKIGDFYKSSLLRGHLFAKVKIGTTLELQFLDPDKLKKLLAEEPRALQHTLVNEDELVLTAATADLQKFFKKHTDNAALWGEAGKLNKQLL